MLSRLNVPCVKGHVKLNIISFMCMNSKYEGWKNLDEVRRSTAESVCTTRKMALIDGILPTESFLSEKY